MISTTNPNWRAIRLHDENSIDYLNRMFKRGWHIVPFDHDGAGVPVPYLMMEVPVETPKRVTYQNEHQLLEAQREPSDWIVVLKKGDRNSRNMAICMQRDELAYHDMGRRVPSVGSWRQLITNFLAGGFMVTIYEMDLPDALPDRERG